MSDYRAIANTPTTITREYVKATEEGCKGWHESLLRSYQIVQKLRWLLEKRTDHEVILELLTLMESEEFQPYAYFEKKYKEQYEPGNVARCDL